MTTPKHSVHSCQAIVVSCIDFRFQKYVWEHTTKNIPRGFDRVGTAGGAKELPHVISQIEISARLHKISEVHLINHEDCGAYGAEGNFQRHKNDLQSAGKLIKLKFPKLQVFLFYLKLDGKFVPLK